MSDGIEVYREALTEGVCADLIGVFESDLRSSRYAFQGTAGTAAQVDPTVKDSLDLRLDLVAVAEDVPAAFRERVRGLVVALQNAIVEHARRYLRCYPHVVPNLQLDDPSETYESSERVRRVIDSIDVAASFNPDSLLLMRYRPPAQGFHAYHYDYVPYSASSANQAAIANRALVFLFYLNDVREGGETEFLYQGIRVKPTRGTLVVFPPYYTHVHKGHVPRSSAKYVVNTWLRWR